MAAYFPLITSTGPCRTPNFCLLMGFTLAAISFRYC